MKRFRSLLALASLALMTACSSFGLIAVNLPTHFDDVKVIHDVPYGPQPWQTLDIYIPPGAEMQKKDVIVFFYGGRWETGDKSDYAFVGSSFAHENFITVIPNYSKYPQVRFPVFVQDGAKAMSWTYDHIAEYNGVPHHIHIAGHSAGAHIGALLTVDKRYLAAEGKNVRDVIQSFAGLAGPYDFTPDDPDLKDIFGPPSRYPTMQVTTFIDGTEPPMLLLWGDADTDVKRYNLDKLQKRILQKGGQVQTIIYPGVNHIHIIAALSWLNVSNALVLEDMRHFFVTQQQ